MATLHNETIRINDSVYDIVYGAGRVVAIDAAGRITVSFGSAGRPRKYSAQGVTGKLCYRTLFHRPPAIIEFPRDECNAAKLACALTDVMKIFNSLTDCKSDASCDPCDTAPQECAQWQ